MDVGNAEAKLGAQSAEPDSVVLHDGMGMSGSVVPAAVLSDAVAASKIADGGGSMDSNASAAAPSAFDPSDVDRAVTPPPPSAVAGFDMPVVRGGSLDRSDESQLRWVPYQTAVAGSHEGAFAAAVHQTPTPPEPPQYEVKRDASPIPPSGYAPGASASAFVSASFSPPEGPAYPPPSGSPYSGFGSGAQPASSTAWQTPYGAPSYSVPNARPQQPGASQSMPYSQPSTVSQPWQSYVRQPAPGSQPAPAAVPEGKDRMVAGILAILFGAFGVHKFYLGYYVPAFLMLGITLLGGFVSLSVVSWAVWAVAIVEGIIYLSKTPQQFYWTYVAHKREWF